jgi:hypothetical protein
MPDVIETNDPLDSIFGPDFFKDIGEAVRDTHPVMLHDDPFALAVASWRRAVESNYAIRWMTLTECRATDADRIRAGEMKKFYQDKIAIKALINSVMTDFCRDLYEMINTGQVTHQQLGMLMRLPYFYQEDLDRLEIAQQVNSLPHRRITLAQAMRYERVTHQLTPLKKIFSGRKNSELWEYWFVTEFNDPVCWSIKTANPLISIVEGLFARPYCWIEGHYHVGQRRGNDLTHLWIGSPRVVFDQPTLDKSLNV